MALPYPGGPMARVASIIDWVALPRSGGDAPPQQADRAHLQLRSAAPVHVGSVLDTHDVNDGVPLQEPVDDPIGAAPRREVPGQLAPERLAHAARVLAKGAAAELPDGEGNRKRQLVLKGTPGSSRKS